MKKVMILLIMLLSTNINAKNCKNSLFSVTIDSKITIGDAIENLAESCDFSIIVKDEGAKKKLNKKLYYVKIKNKPLKSFLNIILSENDLSYTLKGNKLSISYLTTKTYRIHYIAGHRTGKSNSSITVAKSTNSIQNENGISQNNNGSRGSGISIESNDDFQFWDNIKNEVHRILIGASDGGAHYTKTANGWIGPNGQEWEYNPLEPIVNPTAGMLTVTGTRKQLNRVNKYVAGLKKQIKKQVMIEVKMISVKFNNNRTRGVDWNQIYGLQNATINTLAMAQRNVSNYKGLADGITDAIFEDGASPRKGGVIQITSSVSVNEIVKFLTTQGDVKVISSPKIMTLNNQPALISVGKELFYKIKSSTATNNSGGGGFTAEGETVSSVFAGILLDITPEIGLNGEITLKINPSVSDTIDPITRDANGERTMPPDLIKRQISSVIKVKNGHHAILGGLISTGKGMVTTKVPLLGDIPFLGYAFKKEEIRDETEELVIIITPYLK